MNSKERHEARYQRRKAKRLERLKERNDQIGGLEEVYRFDNLFRAGLACCKGVRWKDSTKNFERHLLSGTARRRREVLSGTWKPRPYNHFTINERGKRREITAPHIADRQVHKAFVRGVLLPLYTPSMIYDNGASIPGKGFHFSKKRLADYLRWHIRRYGISGGIFLMDFKGFFPNAPHGTILERHKRYILDTDLRELGDKIVKAPMDYETRIINGRRRNVPILSDRGMGIGIEPSQTEMVSLPSALDNFLKCQLSIKGAAHYMDDFNIVMPDLEEAKETAPIAIAYAEGMGIPVNRDKSRVIPFGKPFRYCKAGYIITPTGGVKTKGNRTAGTRAYKKFRALCEKYERGEITRADVDNFFQCTVAYFENYNDHTRKLHLIRLYRGYFERDKTMDFFTYKRFKGQGLDGYFNLPYGTILTVDSAGILHAPDGRRVCADTSETGWAHFRQNTAEGARRQTMLDNLYRYYEKPAERDDRMDDFAPEKWPAAENLYWKNLLRTMPTEELEKFYRARLGEPKFKGV